MQNFRERTHRHQQVWFWSKKFSPSMMTFKYINLICSKFWAVAEQDRSHFPQKCVKCRIRTGSFSRRELQSWISKPFWTWQVSSEDLREPWISDYLLRYRVDFLKTEERSCHKLEIQFQRKFVAFCRKMFRVFPAMCVCFALCQRGCVILRHWSFLEVCAVLHVCYLCDCLWKRMASVKMPVKTCLAKFLHSSFNPQ